MINQWMDSVRDWIPLLSARSQRSLADSFGVFVLGMHRSGTSCLTGLLGTCGFWLGDVAESTKGNPKGSYERKQINRVNESILQQSGGSWSAPPAAIDWRKIGYRSIQRSLRTYTNHSFWAVKDPRFLITLDGWLTQIDQPHLVGTFRHPAAVAESLRKRNRFEEKRGVDLWVNYNRRLINYHRKFQFPLVSFDSIGKSYLVQFSRVCETLGISADPSQLGSVYKSDLVHQQANHKPLEGEAQDVYDYLQSNCILRVGPRSEGLAA